mmetsp:Transcript_16234/g.51863  ORF Transcript_16234/g.51863 Transcript_16234/m.51863 type:complete len:290 (-) Transcript_16234:1593-2462(-)
MASRPPVVNRQLCRRPSHCCVAPGAVSVFLRLALAVFVLAAAASVGLAPAAATWTPAFLAGGGLGREVLVGFVPLLAALFVLVLASAASSRAWVELRAALRRLTVQPGEGERLVALPGTQLGQAPLSFLVVPLGLLPEFAALSGQEEHVDDLIEPLELSGLLSDRVKERLTLHLKFLLEVAHLLPHPIHLGYHGLFESTKCLLLGLGHPLRVLKFLLDHSLLFFGLVLCEPELGFLAFLLLELELRATHFPLAFGLLNGLPASGLALRGLVRGDLLAQHLVLQLPELVF